MFNSVGSRLLKRTSFVLLLALLLTPALGSQSAVTTAAQMHTVAAGKDDPHSSPPSTSGGTTTSGPPQPGSKNATDAPAYDPQGVTTSGPAAPGSKNYQPTTGAAAAEPDSSAAATGRSTGWLFQACGTVQDGGWTTTSASFEPIRSCTLTFPENGFVYLAGSTSVGVGAGGNYEARFNLSIDDAGGNSATDRWVNAYTDGGDGTDKSSQVTLLAPVSAGAHTFYYLGARYSGTGTVQLYDPSLSVLYFPSSSADVQSCGVASNTLWTTTETTFQAIRSCALNVPQSGFVYISGTASVGLGAGGAYEGRFRVGVEVNGSPSSDRWINITTDGGDGTDESVATSLLSSVDTGARTFYFSGARYAGTGTVQVYDPTLSVLYFPAPNVTAKVCGASGSDSWTNSTTTYSIIRSCTLNVPRNGFAFIDASASAGLNAVGAGNEWEGQFRVGVDNDTGTSLSDRWVNVYTDSGDGTDRTVSNTLLTNISAGVRTFYYVGRRYAGPGTARVYSPSLTVIVPGDVRFIPFAPK